MVKNTQSQEVLDERTRICSLVIAKMDEAIQKKEESATTGRQRGLGFSIVKRLKENIVFWINNPNYVTKKEAKARISANNLNKVRIGGVSMPNDDVFDED